MRTRHVLLTAAVLGAAGLAAWINLPAVAGLFGEGAAQVSALPRAAPFRAGQRVLVLSPHPDDETLCCAGMIQQAQAAGARVFIAWVTAGDGFEVDAVVTERVADPGAGGMRALGNTRAVEARRAGALLGVPPERTFLLGYPDGGLFRLFTINYAEPFAAP